MMMLATVTSPASPAGRVAGAGAKADSGSPAPWLESRVLQRQGILRSVGTSSWLSLQQWASLVGAGMASASICRRAMQCEMGQAAVSSIGSSRRRQRFGASLCGGGPLAEGTLLRPRGLFQQCVVCSAQNQDSSGDNASEEVIEQLKKISDEGLGTDIVTAGFVAEVLANKKSGDVSVTLEVSMFDAQVTEALKQLPWVRAIEVRAKSADEKPPAPPQPAEPGKLPPPPSMAKVKSVIAVSSCKGGVGKSAVAVNLAFELQKSGAKVGIFDCDIYGPSLPVMVKMPEELLQLEMFIDEQEQRHIVPAVHPDTGIKLVSFGYIGDLAIMRGSIITSLIVQLLTQTDWGELDYLVLDLPPGTGDIHLTLAQTCEMTAAVIVTTPQKLSIIDVERGISMFRKLEVPSVAVVQNMSYFAGPDGEKMYPFGDTGAGEEIAEAFGIKHVFEIPIDPAVSAGGDSGVPFVVGSDGKPTQVIADLAKAVVKEVDEILSNQPPKVLSPEFT